MLSQYQILSEFKHSSEQQMGSNDNMRLNPTNPFSMRQFVFEARQKDICHNWPFPKEYLEVCIKHGISRVLPPFEQCDIVRKPSHGEDVRLNYATNKKSDVGFIDKHCVQPNGNQKDVKIGRDASMDENVLGITKQVCFLSLSVNRCEHGEVNDLCSDIVCHPLVPKVQTLTTKPSLYHHAGQTLGALPSTTRLGHKRKKYKGKPKKRLVVDVIAEARPCTLEDLDRINESNLDIDPSVKSDENVLDERKESMITVVHDCKLKLAEGFWTTKHSKDDNAGNVNLLEKKRRLMKIDRNGSKSKLCNKIMNPPRTVESNWDSLEGENFVDEGNKGMVKVEHDCKTKLEEGLLETKPQRYGSAGSSNLLGSKKLIMKIKLKGCKPKSWNRKMCSLGTVESKDATEKKLREKSCNRKKLR